MSFYPYSYEEIDRVICRTSSHYLCNLEITQINTFGYSCQHVLGMLNGRGSSHLNALCSSLDVTMLMSNE